MPENPENPENTALLVMDVQDGIVGRFDAPTAYLARLRTAVAAARGAGVPVIHVGIGFRTGHPEISPRNRGFSAMADGDRFTDADPGTAFHSSVAPRAGEAVVRKKRVSGFAGSDLEMLLRARGIETVVLSGIATSGVVLSTLRQAYDLDFGCVVLADGCLDADEEVHRVLTEKVFARQADVTDVDSWVGTL